MPATPRGFRGIFRRDDEARAVYSESAGIQRIIPTAVAVPVDSDDLATLLEWARAEGAGLIPRGSGSSMAGAAVGSGVIVDLSRWKDIDSSRLDEQRVVVGSGAICGVLAAAVVGAKLRLPVSPSSAAFCTFGGMAATNAAGAHSLAFGAMRPWVTGIECMFADGTRAWIRRGEKQPALPGLDDPSRFSGLGEKNVCKDSSGYATAQFAKSGDLVDLLVGSEGTLALFTRVETRLIGTPAAAASVMGVFPSLAAATQAAILAREAGVVACELLDKTFLDFVGTNTGKAFDATTEAILLADVEGESVAAAADGARTVSRAFARSGASETRIADDYDEREALWALRHAASPMLRHLSPNLKSMQFIEDGAVPPERLGEYVAGVRAALDRQQVRGVIFGHAGDAHVHVNPLIDMTRPDWRQRFDALFTEVTTLVASLGGTLSGEHGDGRVRTAVLDRVWDATALASFAAVKRAFDPSNLLNPGVKVGGDASVGAIRYDPALPPLPDRAARALADMERSKGYDRFRLELLDSK